MLNLKKAIAMDQYRVTISFLVVLAILYLVGCQGKPSIEKKYRTSTFVPVRDLTDNQTVQDFLIDYGIDLFRSIVIAHKGQVIIASGGGRLTSVSMDGNVNWSLTRPGRGPGEFEDPWDMQIADDLIGILNIERARINLYTVEGDFYKDVQFNSSPDQFGMVNGEIHLFYPFGAETLFAAYDIETGEEVRRYGKKELVPELPPHVTPQNAMQYSSLLQVDERYTLLALPYYALILIFDRLESRGVLLDMSQEKEVAASLELHRKHEKNFPPGSMVTFHFMDVVKIGNYFGVTVPGPSDVESALMYRLCPDGRIYDKIYRPSGEEFRLSQMTNLTLLSDSTYFGHIDSQDRLVIVSIEENELPG